MTDEKRTQPGPTMLEADARERAIDMVEDLATFEGECDRAGWRELAKALYRARLEVSDALRRMP